MAYNFKFAKINESGALEYAPLPLVINGENVWTNIEGTYNEQGYYLIERTDTPIKEGYYYTDYWELENNNRSALGGARKPGSRADGGRTIRRSGENTFGGG